MDNPANKDLLFKDLLNKKGIKLFEEEIKHRKETFEKKGALPAVPPISMSFVTATRP